MKTLQEQYNLIKEGKGNKEILLKTAKQLYPNVIPNHFTYNQAVPLLKQRGLLHESIGGVVRATLGNAAYSDGVLLRSAFGIPLHWGC